MMEVKQPTTFSEQIEKMKARGCIISDEAACTDFLKKVNYYRLSAYFLPFRKSDHTYTVETTFEKIRGIYEFDQKMRAILFSIIEEVETRLRARLAYYHAHKYGPLGYMDITKFDVRKHDHERFIEQIKAEIGRNEKSPFVKHHLSTYEGKFPIWAVIELFSMGMLSHFYSDLRLEDRKNIAHDFETKENYLSSWLRCLTVLRNICAHYGRLYFLKFTNHPKLPPSSAASSDQQLFAQIYMLKLLYFPRDKWLDVYMQQIKALIEQYSDHISLDHIGFPERWEGILDASL